MDIVTRADEFRQRCEELRSGGPVGLVLTMGALHEGHVSLMKVARSHASSVVTTVFVNPTQFGPNEDFNRYPRDLEQDAKVCREAGADVLFAPAPSDMYPEGEQTRVRVGDLAAGLCGAFRPGHFEGVATVVTKFFALAGPVVAVFGEKDYQQLKIIERTVKDLLLPVKVIGAPHERTRALGLVSALRRCSELFRDGERRVAVLEDAARSLLTETDVEYASVVNGDTLAPYSAEVDGRARLLLAVRVGNTRLIDNCSLAEGVA
jgi:pantoate--beta-alanine ligase